MEYTAALIVIGNEILSGRTQDKNLAFLGQQLEQIGIQLRECRVIPDVEATIINTVKELKDTFTYVFTTGGIGPTHDDITAAAIARCFGTPLSRNQEAVEMMKQYYHGKEISEARLKMADIPDNAILIANPVSGAPGFQLENVFVLPGVPAIMQAMFAGIVDRLTGGDPVLTVNIITNLSESHFAKQLTVIQEKYSDISIGSYPFYRNGRPGVNLVLRSTDTEKLDVVKHKVGELINELGGKIME